MREIARNRIDRGTALEERPGALQGLERRLYDRRQSPRAHYSNVACVVVVRGYATHAATGAGQGTTRKPPGELGTSSLGGGITANR